MAIQFGREICGDVAIAEKREWLVTNGIGGYACGTVAGVLTRHYHGLLVAALKPPVGRMLMVGKLDETVTYLGQTWPLFVNRWGDGQVNPSGHHQIERFELLAGVPQWQFAIADARLTKRIWMAQGENTTYVQYHLAQGDAPLTLTAKALVNYRDHHGGYTDGDWQVQPIPHGVQVTAFPGASPLYLFCPQGEITPQWDWYLSFDLAVERYRGTGSQEDHLHAADVSFTLQPGETITLVASACPEPKLDGAAAWAAHCDRTQNLINLWTQSLGKETSVPTPDWIAQLVLAADQFIVDRAIADEPQGKTVIAGYPWFGDWGRDTMISLPGLTVATGRAELARPILRTFGRYLSQGMLPNLFPDSGQAPEYNTVDAILWYFEAIRAYYQATGDLALLEELFPALTEVIDWHRRGTRYQIHLDATDGLIYAGEPGVQLTWMDAKVGDWVVTPRIGKPIEVNALWYNALLCMSLFAQQLGKSGQEYTDLAEQTRQGFQRYWDGSLGYCLDVLDGPEGNDTSLRPNQIFAVALPQNRDQPCLLSRDRQQAVLTVVAQQLLTSYGLRSLAPSHPDYRGHYGGSPYQRDSVYHQGTVWGWLIGPFVQAHLRVHGDPDRARSLLLPLSDHLTTAGLGTISEIFDGNPPHHPRGCFAQAWSVAEVLRAWRMTGQ